MVMGTVGMNAMAYILKNVFSAGLIALVVLFQPELRRSLEKMGHTKVSKLSVFSSLTADSDDVLAAKWSTAIEAICDACEDLSATTTGALIVIEQDSKLGEQIDTGTVLNAAPSKELFGNIFYPKTPLHDGAVIMLIIVVSEETGTISVAENGDLKRGYTRDSLKKLLRTKLLPEKNTKQKPSGRGKSDDGGEKDTSFKPFRKKKFTDKI